MKRILIPIFLMALSLVNGQESQLSLNECIEMALKDQPEFQAEKVKVQNGILDIDAARSALGPQVSLSYLYKYNAIIPTSLVPNTLTGEPGIEEGLNDFTELQFGTTWQQDLGISLFQPLFDKSIWSEIDETRLKGQLDILERDRTTEELVFNVLEAYISLSQRQVQVESNILDTLRTYRTFKLIKSGYAQGKELKTELNTAIMNHNNAKMILTQTKDQKLKEEFDLGFLIGAHDRVGILIDDYEYLNASFLKMKAEYNVVESSLDLEIIKVQDKLLSQQINSNRVKRLPTIAFEAFWGANQFNESLRPFEKNTWFGNSFLGISMKVPLLSSNGTKSEIAKLKGEKQIKDLQLLEEQNRINLEQERLQNTIGSLNEEIGYLEQNLALRKENVAIYQARFSNGKINAYDLNEQETLLQKGANEVFEKQSKLWRAIMEQYKMAGRLPEFLN